MNSKFFEIISGLGERASHQLDVLSFFISNKLCLLKA
jgi:hypothetical protein